MRRIVVAMMAALLLTFAASIAPVVAVPSASVDFRVDRAEATVSGLRFQPTMPSLSTAMPIRRWGITIRCAVWSPPELLEQVTAGFPFRSLGGEWAIRRRPDATATPYAAAHACQMERARVHNALPWIPIWGGLLGNLLVYTSATLACVSVGPMLAAFVGRRRRKGGRCAQCGYQLLASQGVCPECEGTRPVPKVIRRATTDQSAT